MPVVKRKVLVFCMTVLFSLSCAVTALASFQRGDDGQEVVAIQKRLVELSYSINNIDVISVLKLKELLKTSKLIKD